VKKVAVDTSVWIESIAIGSTYFDLASEIVERINREEIKAIITPLTASETYYIAYKVYKQSGLNEKTAVTKAEKLFNLLYSHRNIKIVLNKIITLKASEIKRKYNIALSDAYLLATANNKSSMLQDIERRKKTEIDYINGAIVKLGKKLKIKTPVNKTLTALVKAIEWKLQPNNK